MQSVTNVKSVYRPMGCINPASVTAQPGMTRSLSVRRQQSVRGNRLGT